MELSVTVKSKYHAGNPRGSAFQKYCYIDRTKAESKYDGRLYDFTNKARHEDDMVFTSTLTVDGMPENFEDFGEMLNDIETSSILDKYNSIVARDWMLILDNRLLIRDDDGVINKYESERLIRDELDRFFSENFSSKGYGCHYVVHAPDKGEDNYHIHAITLCNRYDKDAGWLQKSYRDEHGRKQYCNVLDQKNNSKKELQRMRNEFAQLQNKKLRELGYDDDMVESKSFSDRKIDRMSTYHLSRYHYNELIKLKGDEKYKGMSIAERNSQILKDREGKLTKKQIHNLKAEIYNAGGHVEELDIADVHNAAMTRSFENKKAGFINHELSRVSHGLIRGAAETLTKSAAEAQKGADKGMRGR